MQRIISFIFFGIGAILFYIFMMTLIGSLDGGMYLIFEVILMIVWGFGAILFLGIGLVLIKTDKKRRTEKKEEKET